MSRVQGTGFKVKGLWFRAWGQGFRVQDLESRIQGQLPRRAFLTSAQANSLFILSGSCRVGHDRQPVLSSCPVSSGG